MALNGKALETGGTPYVAGKEGVSSFAGLSLVPKIFLK
jgi:hypothetical protein